VNFLLMNFVNFVFKLGLFFILFILSIHVESQFRFFFVPSRFSCLCSMCLIVANLLSVMNLCLYSACSGPRIPSAAK